MNEKTTFTFPKQHRLLHSREFKEVMYHGESKVGQYLIIQIKQPKKLSSTKLGITVSRRFGKSHERNRFKRLVREAFRLAPALPHNLWIHIKPRSFALTATMQQIQQEMLHLLNASFI